MPFRSVAPLSLFLLLASEASAAASLQCQAPTKEQEEELYETYAASASNLARLPSARAPLQESMKCLRAFVEGRRAACKSRDAEALDKRQAERTGGESGNGCAYLSTVFVLSRRAAEELRHAQELHEKVAENLDKCLSENEKKLQELIPTPEEKKQHAAAISGAPKDLQKLSRLRKGLVARELNDSTRLESAATEAEAHEDQLRQRAKDCLSVKKEKLQLKVPRFR